MRRSQLPPQLRALVDAAIGGGGKPHKFRVSDKLERQADGITFASKWECRVYQWLKQYCGTTVTLQPRFRLLEKQPGQRAVHYCADFIVGSACAEFTTAEELPEHCVIVDAKGFLTPEFKLKQKFFRARFLRHIFLPKSPNDLWNFPWEDFGILIRHARIK